MPIIKNFLYLHIIKKLKFMRLLVLLLFVGLSFNSYSNKINGKRYKKHKHTSGMNYKKIKKTHHKYKKRNVYGCNNYSFKK